MLNGINDSPLARQNRCMGRLTATRMLRNRNKTKTKKLSLDSSSSLEHQNKTITMKNIQGSSYWWHPTPPVIPTPSLHLGVGMTSWWPPHTSRKWHETIRTPTRYFRNSCHYLYAIPGDTCSPAVLLGSKGPRTYVWNPSSPPMSTSRLVRT